MQPLNKIIEILDLEEIEQNHYLATSPNEGWQRVYGGQVIGQALVAASRTVADDRQAHSLHGYFLRAGDKDKPILIKSTVFVMAKFYHQTGYGRSTRSGHFHDVHFVSGNRGWFVASIPMPETPGPDNLLGEEEVRAEQAKNWPEEFQETFSGSSAIELRPVEPLDLMNPQKTDPTQRCWMRCGETLPDDPRLHQCVLAYLSDWSLLDTLPAPMASAFYRTTFK